MSGANTFLTELSDALGVPPEALDRSGVLELVRDVAHGVERPAAPLSAYLVGYAAGRRGNEAGAREALATAKDHVATWTAEHPQSEGAQ